MRKIKIFLEAVIVSIAVLAFFIPGSAIVTNENENIAGFERVEIQGQLNKKPINNVFAGENIWVTPFVGEDILPSITEDLDGHVVITWTNEQSFSESFFGITYSADPADPNTWYDNALVLILTENDYYFDTALIQGPGEEDYKGLMGVFISLAEESVGYYEILDITSSFEEWPIYTWSSTAEEPYYAAISDGGYVDVNGGRGPYYFYVFNGDLCGDLSRCPVFVHLDIPGDGGSFYYDCQDYEQTAPSGST